MEPDQTREMAYSVLAEVEMEETRDYLTRGRRFRSDETEKVKERWVAASKAWDGNRNHPALVDLSDARAEL
jgi:hypothetical protein